MKRRDVTDDEILDLMARPISQHRPGNVPGRREIEAKIGDHVFTIIYRALESTIRRQRQELPVYVIINALRGEKR